MFSVTSREINWQNKKLSLETGKIARQADGSVIVRMGDTTILCAVTSAKGLKEGIDFFPLTVNYLEKYYANGRYPGGFFKREAKPTEREALISRLIDRPIRPLFPKDYLKEISIVCTVLSYDQETQTDVLALIGAVAALNISSVPFKHNLAAVKVAEVNGDFISNPNSTSLTEGTLDLTVAGKEDSILMIESSSKEIAGERLIEAIEFAHNEMQPVINLIKDFTEGVGREKEAYEGVSTASLVEEMKKLRYDDFVKAYLIKDKAERSNELQKTCEALRSHVSERPDYQLNLFNIAIKTIKREVVRNMILQDGLRVDGRGIADIRPIECEIDILTTPHGSSLFTRGETQSIATVTLGSSMDRQMNDNMTGVTNDSFLLHYNFPPYSVGECGMLRPPGRREIGHGKLAKKALEAVLPKQDEFAYTIRVVSEITESNGSSSMATVCASSLSLMSAGVPIKSHVAGIAMGLILEKDRHAIISDILGEEDALGDMDFKVATTKHGITALQMDIKVSGITINIMREAVEQAREGCMSILSKMEATLVSPKAMSQSAPKMLTINVSKEKIKDIIGPGGKVIKDICEKSQAKIDIEDSGELKIFAPTGASIDIVREMIDQIVAEPVMNNLYEGKVIKLMEFGAFIRFFGKTDGLVHISEIFDKRINKIEDFLQADDGVTVKFIGLDKRGKFKLSMKGIEQSPSLTSRESWKKV